MKQKILMFALLILFVQAKSFAQEKNQKSKIHASFPIITEDGIFSIIASDKIDVVLIQDDPENVKVKASDNVASKLKLSMTGGRLFLEAGKNVKEDERLVVYVWVNELKNLTLKGNAFAMSQEVLEGSDLHVSIGNEASVLIKSRGKVWFDAPSNHQVIKQNGYFMLTGL